MKNKKQIILASILGLLSFGAAAQDTDVTVFVNPKEITVEDGKAKVEIWVDSQLDHLNAFDFQLFVPEGFEIEKKKNGTYKFTVNPDESMELDHAITAGEHFEDPTNPYYKFVGVSMTNTYLPQGRNMVFWFNLTVPETFTTEAYPNGAECHLGNITIVDNVPKDGGGFNPTGYHPADFYFTILPHNPGTGVTEVTVDGVDDAIYDLHGLRVYPPLAPGVYITNGKKIMVK